MNLYSGADTPKKRLDKCLQNGLKPIAYPCYLGNPGSNLCFSTSPQSYIFQKMIVQIQWVD